MDSLPYATKYATDVITPEKGVAVSAPYTPPVIPQVPGGISCAGATYGVILVGDFTYTKLPPPVPDENGYYDFPRDNIPSDYPMDSNQVHWKLSINGVEVAQQTNQTEDDSIFLEDIINSQPGLKAVFVDFGSETTVAQQIPTAPTWLAQEAQDVMNSEYYQSQIIYRRNQPPIAPPMVVIWAADRQHRILKFIPSFRNATFNEHWRIFMSNIPDVGAQLTAMALVPMSSDTVTPLATDGNLHTDQAQVVTFPPMSESFFANRSVYIDSEDGSISVCMGDGEDTTTPISCDGAQADATVLFYAREELLSGIGDSPVEAASLTASSDVGDAVQIASEGPSSSLDEMMQSVLGSFTITLNGTETSPKLVNAETGGTVSPDALMSWLAARGISMTLSSTPYAGEAPYIPDYVNIGVLGVFTNIGDSNARLLINFAEGNDDQYSVLLIPVQNSSAGFDISSASSTVCLGVSAIPPITCEGAASVTPPVVLNGLWDIEVDGRILYTGESEQDLLEMLNFEERPELLEQEGIEFVVSPYSMRYNCVPKGSWVFKNTNRNRNIGGGVDTKLHLIIQQTELDPDTGEAMDDSSLQHIVLKRADTESGPRIMLYHETYGWEEDIYDCQADSNPINHYDILLHYLYRNYENLFYSRFQPDYNSLQPSAWSCDANGATYTMRIAVQNTAAIKKSNFNFYNSYGNSAGYLDFSYTNNVFRMKAGWSTNSLDELPSFNFATTTDTASVERAMLNHFAAQLSSQFGATCRIVEEPWQVIPTAFDATYTPKVNSMYLMIETRRELFFVTPKQKTGSANEPQLQNVTYGFEQNNPGLLAAGTRGGYSPDWSGIRSASFNECIGRVQYLHEFDPNFEISFIPHYQPVSGEISNDWTPQPSIIKLMTFDEVDMLNGPNDVNILDLFNISEEDREIFVCGTNQPPPM